MIMRVHIDPIMKTHLKFIPKYVLSLQFLLTNLANVQKFGCGQ